MQLKPNIHQKLKYVLKNNTFNAYFRNLKKILETLDAISKTYNTIMFRITSQTRLDYFYRSVKCFYSPHITQKALYKGLSNVRQCITYERPNAIATHIKQALIMQRRNILRCWVLWGSICFAVICHIWYMYMQLLWFGNIQMWSCIYRVYWGIEQCVVWAQSL